MWTGFVFLNLWALHCSASSSVSSPISVLFSSVNLRNTLHWSPGNGTPDGTQFTVQYAIYGDSSQDSKGRRVHWRAVKRCADVTRSWCDLSNETWDLEEGYYARVRAGSRRAYSVWTMTKRFDPKLDTTFGPPLVSVEIEDSSATITLIGPMKYQPNNHTPAVSMATLYPQMMYNLSIHNKHRDQVNHFIVSSRLYKYRLMDYDTEYCFSAKTKFLSMPVQCQSSAWHCITTPPDPVTSQIQKIVVGIVVPSVCLCLLLVVGYLLYHYLSGKGQKSPYILNLISFNQPVLTIPPEKPNQIVINVLKSDVESHISDPKCPKRWPNITGPPQGYASKRFEAPPEPEDPWDDVSIDYGFVGIAPKANVRGDEEEKDGSRDGEEVGNTVKGVYATQETHTCSQTPMPLHRGAETDTLVRAQPFSPVSLVPLSHTQDGDEGFQGLFINKTPQFGLFRFPFEAGEMGEELESKVRIRADGRKNGGVEEGGERERVPLLSAYACQNGKDMSNPYAARADLLPDEYGVLRMVEGKELQSGEGREEEEEESIFIDWDPNTRKLVLSEMELTEEGRVHGLMQGEREGENRMGEREGEVTLESVYVRQGSEEEAEAQRELERGGEKEWEADGILTKWNLVISMDE